MLYGLVSMMGAWWVCKGAGAATPPLWEDEGTLAEAEGALDEGQWAVLAEAADDAKEDGC